MQRADEMPFEPEVRQCLDLGNALLHVVLAESTLPGGSGLAHAFGGPCLADRQQPHPGGISPGGHGGPGNAHDKVLEAAGKA